MSRTELISAIDDFKIQKKNLSLQVKKQKKEHAKANASLNLEIEKARKNLFRENQMYQKISHRINAIQESLSGFDFTIEFLETEKTLLTNLLDTDMVTTIAASYEQIQNEINDLKLQLEKNRYSIECIYCFHFLFNFL